MALTFFALVLLSSDTRRVEISPGFELSSGRVEYDVLVVRPDGSAEIKSTRGFAGSKQQYAAELPVGTELTVVFSSPEHAEPYMHSVVGPIEVVAGDGPLLIPAEPEMREAVSIKTDAAEPITYGPILLALPLPEDAVPRDERSEEAKSKAGRDQWTVAVPARVLSDQETKAQRVENLSVGRRYTTVASALGYESSEFVIDSDATELTIKLEPVDPAILTVKSTTGQPIADANIYLRQKPPPSGPRIYFPLMPKPEDAVQTDENGRAIISKIRSDKVYDVYVDGQERGRALLTGLVAGQSKDAILSIEPAMTVRLKNLKPNEVEKIVAQEYLFRDTGIPSVVHGPFDVTGDETEFVLSLPSPIGETINISGVGEKRWKRKLHINARGREAVIDLADPSDDVYVEPLLAPETRLITIRFRPPNDDVDVKPTYFGILPGSAPWNGKFTVSQRGRTDDEKASRSYRSVEFEKSGKNAWSKSFQTDETVRIDFDRMKAEGFLVDNGEGGTTPHFTATIGPGDDDVVVDVKLVPAVSYSLNQMDFEKAGENPSRIPFTSEGLTRSGNDSEWLSTWRGKLRPDHVDLPAGRKSLLLINDEPRVIVKHLDGQGGEIRFDSTAAKRTTVQAVTPDGRRLSTRTDGFVLPNSGIAKPVSVYYGSEEVAASADGKSSISATQLVMELQADEPAYIVLVGYGNEAVKQVLPIKPGEHHEVVMTPGRTLWVDLLNPDGSDFRFGGRTSGTLYGDREDGIEMEFDENYYDQRFVGIPRDAAGPFRFVLWLEEFGYATTLIDPGEFDDATAVGVVVSLPENPDGKVQLVQAPEPSQGQRKRNRDRASERGRN